MLRPTMPWYQVRFLFTEHSLAVWFYGGLGTTAPASEPVQARQRMANLPFLTVRFLFAYYDLGYPGPTVGRHEFAPRSKQRGNTVVPETLGATQSCIDALLRLSGNAAALTLLSTQSSS